MASTMSEYNARMQFLRDRLGGCCVQCGSAARLEFDHIDKTAKKFTIARCWSLRLEDLLVEVDKCQLLCRPCHEAKSLAAGDLPPRATHGTEAMYRHHSCRCSECRAAHAEKGRRYRARKNGV